jgi:hypothetical protein
MSQDTIRPKSRVEIVHREAARLVADQQALLERLDRYFREIGAVREEARDQGSLWAGPILEPMLQAAFEAWQDRSELTQVEPAALAPMPLMDIER